MIMVIEVMVPMVCAGDDTNNDNRVLMMRRRSGTLG